MSHTVLLRPDFEPLFPSLSARARYPITTPEDQRPSVFVADPAEVERLEPFENLDRLATVEMRVRGIPQGIVRRLYEAARLDGPLTHRLASALLECTGGRVAIFTGIVLGQLPHGEVDGPIGAERQLFPPEGVLGGSSALPNRVAVIGSDGTRVELASKITDYHVAKGELISFETGGGGGYGDRRDRDPALVEADVRGGYVRSREQLDQEYAVVLEQDADGIDLAATAARCGSAVPAGASRA